MDPVKGINQIARILRQKISERSPSSSKTDLNTSTLTAAPHGGAAAKANVDELKRKIAERIKALSADDRRKTKAAQIFVEMVMTWEFGEQLLQDPQFTELSKEVVNAMAENPALWKKLQTLLNEFGQAPA